MAKEHNGPRGSVKKPKPSPSCRLLNGRRRQPTLPGEPENPFRPEGHREVAGCQASMSELAATVAG